jgi:hypothetical protein
VTREPRPHSVTPFGTGEVLAQLGDGAQLRYLTHYLLDLSAAWVVSEPYYFDRDYLAEYAAFYSVSARPFPNVCRRLHPPVPTCPFVETSSPRTPYVESSTLS